MKQTSQRQILPDTLILVILLLAFALRLHALAAQSLWYDEAVTAQVVGRDIAELTRWTADDIQPPLYYYVVAGWTRLAGRSEWALRFPSVFFGVLTAALLWTVARRLFGRVDVHVALSDMIDKNGTQTSVDERGNSWGSAFVRVHPRPVFRADGHAARGATADENEAAVGGRQTADGRLRTAVCGRRSAVGIFRAVSMPLLEHNQERKRQPSAFIRARPRPIFGLASGRLPAGLTALLAAVLPLYVYFAQEARMYTLLTFLGVLAGYALLRTAARDQGSGVRGQGTGDSSGSRGKPAEASIPEDRSHGQGGWWITFVLASTAMLYTHYFGVFLLIAYACCFLAAWLLNPGSSAAIRARLRPLLSFGIATLAIILLYLPWLPAMLNRYRADASYWQGALKLGEALRHVALSFTVAAPEMMLEPEGIRLLPFFGVTLLVAIAALIWRRQAGAAITLLSVLFIPLLAVLLLASRTPKFNPRYLMLVSPAYLLLLAGGITALAVSQGRSRISRSGIEPVRSPLSGSCGLTLGESDRLKPRLQPLAMLLTVFLVAMSLLAIRNWFTDPAFTKSQWRELTTFVRQARAADEAVLLVSGHAYPAWDYYAADIPAARLPPIDILDVNAVLGFETGAGLAAALGGKAGAWLVTWQDEVVDPVGFVPYFLDRAGVEQPDPASFWHVGLRHWRLRGDATYPTEPQPQHVQGANFDHKLALLGWDAPEDGQITVYWRVLNTLQQDYQVSVGVENAYGRPVGHWDGRPAGYDYPAPRWRPGQALVGRYPLALPAGAPADEYTVTLTVYAAADPAGLDIRDEADNPAGKRVRLGPVKVE